MNRQQIIDTTDCPKCGAPKGHHCTDGRNARKRSHAERLYRAQDIEAGKPDRITGEVYADGLGKRRCPKCKKVLKSAQGLKDHIRDVHRKGMNRHQHKPVGYVDDDFDLIDEGDVF